MAENIVKTEYSELMQKSYIDYSMSVITARALPETGTETCSLCYGPAWT